jgi:hypothetical protein
MSLTYAEARNKIRAAAPSRILLLERNTRLREDRIDDGPDVTNDRYAYAVQFHETDVVTIFPGNRYALRTGGWATSATVNRIFGYSPVTWRTFYTKLAPRGRGSNFDGFKWNAPPDTSEEWKVAVRPDPNDPEPDAHHNSPTWRAWANRQWVPFYEGIIIDGDGYVLKRIAKEYFKNQRARARYAARRQRALEAEERHRRHLERLRSGYMNRHAARQPRFERIAVEIVNDIRDVRNVLNSNASLEVTRDAG